MLPAAARLRDSTQFRAAVAGGTRAGGQCVVVHLRLADQGDDAASATTPPENPRVGFVVSKRVGNAVARNRVKRRLRHLSRPKLAGLPTGAHVVVRALPPAADEANDLAGDLASAWTRALRKAGAC